MKKKTIVITVIAIAVAASVVIFAECVESNEVIQLTTHTAGDGAPAWSPDGKKIAFASERTGNPDIWVMDSDGGNLRQLTTHTALDAAPAWSPDGKKIAFDSERTGNWDIWVLILE